MKSQSMPSDARMGKDSSYTPQQSNRFSSAIESDNDTWAEYLTIVEMLNMNPRAKSKDKTYQLQIRSFFESKGSGTKVWDEPPSGAKNVVWASEEAKSMAEVQMKDLKVMESGGIANAREENRTLELAPETMEKAKSKKTWRNKISKIVRDTIPRRNKDQNSNSILPRKLAYREGSKTDEFARSERNGEHDQNNSGQRLDINDVNLQLAMAQSLDPKRESLSYSLEPDEALAMAQAMSLSESEFLTYQYEDNAQLEAAKEVSTRPKQGTPYAVDNSTTESEGDRKMSPEELGVHQFLEVTR